MRNLFILCLALVALTMRDDPLSQYRQAAIDKWEADIKKLEALDISQPDPEHAILFVGSSSIRMWETIGEDLAPWPTIRRGYGGAKYSDLAVFIERLVKPHQIDALVIFVGNDIANAQNDKTPDEVLKLVQNIVQQVHELKPGLPIAVIGITPTSSRFQVWDQIKRANDLIEAYCAHEPDLHFIATADSYLKSDGKPDDALFRDDQLHLNRDGYRVWGKLISQALSRILPKHAAAG